MRLSTTLVGNGSKTAALIHGITGDGGTWFEFAPWLAERGYSVILVDQRGHGRSPRAESYLPEELGDDLVETLPPGLDLIVGHSLGGRSLRLAIDRLRPTRAVYLDPAWDVPDDLVIPLPTRDDGSWLSVEELAAETPGVSRGHIENALRAVRLFDRRVLDFPLRSLPVQGEAAVPSLVLLADPTIFVTPGLRRRLEETGYDVRIVPGGGHDLHITDLDATCRAIADWLDTR